MKKGGEGTYLLQFAQCLRANTALLEIALRCRDDLFDDLEVDVALLSPLASTGLAGRPNAPAGTTHHQRVRHDGGGWRVAALVRRYNGRRSEAMLSRGKRIWQAGRTQSRRNDALLSMAPVVAGVGGEGRVLRRLWRGGQVSTEWNMPSISRHYPVQTPVHAC